MNLKGINPLEQHAEKIVLGLVSLVFLGVLAMQFLLQPNAIESGGDSLTPGNVYRSIRGEATNAVSQMEQGRPAFPEFGDTPDLASRFGSMVTSDAPAEPLPIAMGPVLSIESQADAFIDETLPIAPLSVPAPTDTIAASFLATVDPFALEDFPGLERYVDQQPYDLRSVTVEANFDGDAFRRLVLQGDGLGDDVRQMNPRWWREGLEIISIDTERERYDPVSGTWGSATTVRQAPGTIDLLDEHSSQWLSSQPEVEELSDLVAEAGNRAEELLEPMYYPLIAGPAWQPPSARGSVQVSIDRSYRIIDLARQIDQLEGRIAVVEAGPRENTTTGGGVDDPRGGNRGGVDNPGGRQNTGRSAEEVAQERREAQLEELGERLEALNKEFDDLDPTEDERFEIEVLRAERNEEQLARTRQAGTRRTTGRATGRGFTDTFSDLVSPDSRGGRDVRDARGPRSRGNTGRRSALLYNEAVQLWVHDLDVEPGAVYRYRTRITVNNPMYQRGEALRDQPELGEDPFVTGAWSEWSNPVRVDPELYFFVNAASERGQLSTEPLASVEMFRFWYGYWRRGDSNFRPGMPLEVMPENAWLQMPIVDTSEVEDPGVFFDYSSELEDYRLAFNAWRDAQNQPVARDDDDARNPGGRRTDDLAPSGRSGRLGASDAGEEPEEPEALDGVTQVGVGRLFSDLYLLDVVALPFEQPAPNGRVEQMLVDGDTLLGERARVRAAIEAEEMGEDSVDEASALAESDEPEDRLDRWEVVFVGSAGEFIRRSTNADRNSLDFRRLWLSARQGERQTLELGPVSP
jgi:TolA-binding protein